MARSGLPDEVRQRLRETGGNELLHLLDTWGEQLDGAAAALVLQNPYCDQEVVRRLLAHRRLLRAYEVQRLFVRHPATPRAIVLQLLPVLFWRDLVEVGGDVRLPPVVRRAAERHLAARLPGLAVGEKVAIARRASPGLLAALRHDPSPRVVGALLENPRVTEGLLLPLAHSQAAPPPVLSTLAADRRWGARYPLRVALCRNPRTPPQTVLELLPLLKKADQRALARDDRLSPQVRRRAALLSGGDL